MDKLLETIKIVNGTPLFLEFHNKRLNEARQVLFNAHDICDLKDVIQAPPQSGIYRCRVIYSKTIETVEYLPYQTRTFKTFKIVENDHIAYPFKFINREPLNQLVAKKGFADDILIIKKGFVTDTSIANVAFWHHDQWLTPSTPLLKGTTRARLLTEKQIKDVDIRLEDLKHFTKIAIMNALMGFYLVADFKLIV